MSKRPKWALVPNPEYAGREPSIQVAVCHDGSPFITLQCGCGEQLHQHESVTAAIPKHVEIASRCPGCRRELVFPPGFFHAAFRQLRIDGWIE